MATARDPIGEVRQALVAAGLSPVRRVRPPAARTLSASDRKPAALAARIDHTVLKADATRASITKLCAEANAHRFASVCINPVWVEHAARLVDGVDVCTVIGFPLGASSPAAKAREARQAVRDGATELDMVLQVGALREAVPDRAGQPMDGELARLVLDDMRGVVDASGGKLVKVILETCLLSRRQKIAACVLAVTAGVDFVKTSTGFSTGGATTADVRLMRQVVGSGVGVKASGGIRDRRDALAMIRAGADRLGCSSSLAIIAAG